MGSGFRAARKTLDDQAWVARRRHVHGKVGVPASCGVCWWLYLGCLEQSYLTTVNHEQMATHTPIDALAGRYNGFCADGPALGVDALFCW